MIVILLLGVGVGVMVVFAIVDGWPWRLAVGYACWTMVCLFLIGLTTSPANGFMTFGLRGALKWLVLLSVFVVWWLGVSWLTRPPKAPYPKIVTPGWLLRARRPPEPKPEDDVSAELYGEPSASVRIVKRRRAAGRRGPPS